MAPPTKLSTAPEPGLRVPPHNLEAEESVLGACLLSRAAIANALELVSSKDFYKPAHSEVFEAVLEQYARGEPVDAVTLAEELRRRGSLDSIGGKPFIFTLVSAVPTPGSATHYARIVAELAVLRRLIEASQSISDLAYSVPEDVEGVVDQAEDLVYQVSQRRIAEDFKPLKDLLTENYEMVEKLYERGSNITGLATGFHDLDELTAGLQPANLVIIAARPSQGKCLAGDTLLDVPGTGERIPIAGFALRRQPGILGVGPRGQVREAAVTDWIDNGVADCWRVTTALGRTIEATAKHPLLTPAGWCELDQLSAGSSVAVPRSLPVFGPVPLPAQAVRHLAEGIRRQGCSALPPQVWRLDRESLAGLIQETFAGGSSFRTASEQLARDLQHALVRLGVLARLSPQGADWWLEVLSGEARPGEAPGRSIAAQASGTAVATLPATITDLYWDEITSIEPLGPRQVFDLTVPDGSNFIAQDICVHNSALAVSIAQHVAVNDQQPVLIFSLEMSQMELVQRLMCSEARVDSNRLRRGALQDSDWPKLSHALGRLAEAPIFIDDSASVTVMEMRAKCRRLASKGGLGLVIVDYLQLMQPHPSKRSDNRVQEVSEISRSLKILARDLEVPVIAVSQLSRNVEYRSDKRPLLADLRESGSIEQDADIVMFIYRDEVYNPDSTARGIAEIHIAKHRNGPIGKVELAFLDHYTKFANLARGLK